MITKGPCLMLRNPAFVWSLNTASANKRTDANVETTARRTHPQPLRWRWATLDPAGALTNRQALREVPGDFRFWLLAILFDSYRKQGQYVLFINALFAVGKLYEVLIRQIEFNGG